MKVINCSECKGNHDVNLIGWKYNCNETGNIVDLKDDLLVHYSTPPDVNLKGGEI